MDNKLCQFPDLPDHNKVTITLTQDQAEHALLCARMALAQAQLARCVVPATETAAACKRADTFATLVDALQKQIVER